MRSTILQENLNNNDILLFDNDIANELDYYEQIAHFASIKT